MPHFSFTHYCREGNMHYIINMIRKSDKNNITLDIDSGYMEAGASSQFEAVKFFTRLYKKNPRYKPIRNINQLCINKYSYSYIYKYQKNSHIKMIIYLISLYKNDSNYPPITNDIIINEISASYIHDEQYSLAKYLLSLPEYKKINVMNMDCGPIEYYYDNIEDIMIFINMTKKTIQFNVDFPKNSEDANIKADRYLMLCGSKDILTTNIVI